MGSQTPLRLANGAAMFVTLEVTLPSSVVTPVVYYVQADGTLTPAGVDGTWQGVAIAAGGTVLAQQADVPQTDDTTFTLGVLMDHLSDYVIGLALQPTTPPPDENPDSSSSPGGYGTCFIESAGADPIDGSALLSVMLLLGGLGLTVGFQVNNGR